MCPGIAIFAGVPLVSLSCYGVFKYTDGTIREGLKKKLGQEIPETPPSFYVGAGAAVLSYNVTKQSILLVPTFREGGRLGTPSEIKTWIDFWKATGPRACATVIALVGSFMAAGAVRPYVDASTLLPQEKEGPRDRK